MSVENIYTSGQYLAQNPGFHEEDAGWKAALVIAMVRKQGWQVESLAEVGCGSGKVLQLVQQALPGVPCSGYDISPQGIARAGAWTNDHLHFYEADFIRDGAPADLLLMMDVLEHIPDYYGFLQGLQQKANRFIFHIPLDASCRSLLKPQVLLQQRQSVGHIHYFSKEMVWWMLADCGYRICDWQYTKPRTDIDRATGFIRWVKKQLRNASFALFPDWSAKCWGGYSVIISAERS